NDLNLGPRAAHRKCAKIAGDTSGNYHPHGEQVVYPTLVRMAQPWNLIHPLVDGQGNFGSIDGDPPAAMRYTEARLAAPATEMLEDLKLETVDFEDNYDATRTEPVVLPSKFPNLLVNGSTGIAVGMATNLPPHNLGEICDGLLALLDKPDISTAELMRHVPGPDFPTGATICGRSGIAEAYENGRGAITVRGTVKVEQSKRDKMRVVITEIPYLILKNTIAEKIADCVKRGVLPEVSDVRDESGRKHPVRIVLELRRDANEDVVINKLYQYTPLQSNFTIMNIALVGRQPRTLSLKQLMEVFVDHRKEVIRRRATFLLRKARQRAHVVEGLILAVGSIDQVIEVIRRSPDPLTAKDRLMDMRLRLAVAETLRALLPEPFVQRAAGADQRLTGVQAEAILGMQLQRLTGLEIERLIKEYAGLSEEIAEHEAVLREERRVIDIIRNETMELKSKYARPRRTQFGPTVGEMRMEELIADEQVIVTLSHQGYIKRVPVETYRRQGRGGKGVRGGEAREGDFLASLFVASTHNYLLVFTNRGRVYWLKVYDIPSMSRTSRGRSLVNLLKMQANEEYRAVLPVKVFEEKFVFFGTAKGIVKKTPLGAFSRPRPSGIIAITLDPDDALVNVVLTEGGQEIVLGSREGYAIRFNESDVRAMGRSARGVKGMTLRGTDQVVDMVVIETGKSLLTVCEKGLGKRSAIDEYRLTKRGGMGVINIKVTDKNGPVVGLKSVEDTDEIMMITAKGIMLRTDLSEVREIGRATQGVRLIRIDEGDKLVSVAHIAREEDEEDEEQAAEGAGESGAGSADAQAEEAAADQPAQFEADTEGGPPTEENDAPGTDQA
ncbi:MAG: DNA gyrase subunit A, partial [Phycisphaerales bacterium]